MKLDWDYPVHQATEAPKSDATAVKAPRQALPRDAALRVLAGDDARPLLVLRECAVCNKTDDALLKSGIDNEKTLFLARWFHCVKLPVDVLQPDHPFNTLFPDKKSEHLFVSFADGSQKVPLESDTSRVDLWAAMAKVLGAAYVADPLDAYKEIGTALEKLDLLDVRVAELEGRRSDLLEDSGADRGRLRKVEAEIEKVKAQIGATRGEIERLSKPKLKPGAGSPAKPTRVER